MAPEEQRARYMLGNLLARTRRLDQAMEAYNQIHRRIAITWMRAFAPARFSSFSTSPKSRMKCCSNVPSCTPATASCLNMGKLLYDMGKNTAAVRAFERTVQLLPRDPQAHYLLGFMYNAMGHESWALAAWRKAVELAPDAHSLRYDLGYMYIRRSRHDLAAKEFEQVLRYWPEDVETNFMLGLCYKTDGASACHTTV